VSSITNVIIMYGEKKIVWNCAVYMDVQWTSYHSCV